MNTATREFPARMSALDDLLTHVASICRRSGLTEDSEMKVRLVIEELFSNTVHHGYQQDSDRPVWILARTDHDTLSLIYQDEAPQFNPSNFSAGQISDRPGGWGMQLIEHFADIAYRYENGRNQLTLTFKI